MYEGKPSVAEKKYCIQSSWELNFGEEILQMCRFVFQTGLFVERLEDIQEAGAITGPLLQAGRAQTSPSCHRVFEK